MKCQSDSGTCNDRPEISIDLFKFKQSLTVMSLAYVYLKLVDILFRD